MLLELCGLGINATVWLDSTVSYHRDSDHQINIMLWDQYLPIECISLSRSSKLLGRAETVQCHLPRVKIAQMIHHTKVSLESTRVGCGILPPSPSPTFRCFHATTTSKLSLPSQYPLHWHTSVEAPVNFITQHWCLPTLVFLHLCTWAENFNQVCTIRYMRNPILSVSRATHTEKGKRGRRNRCVRFLLLVPFFFAA